MAIRKAIHTGYVVQYEDCCGVRMVNEEVFKTEALAKAWAEDYLSESDDDSYEVVVFELIPLIKGNKSGVIWSNI